MESISNFSLFDFRDDPYSYYAQLREEAPVHFFQSGFYTINRYKDVVAALKRTDLFSSHTGVWQSAPVGEDAPLHTKLRKIASRILAKQKSPVLPGIMAAITEKFLTRIHSQRHFELIGSLASELPFGVIWELLGIPEEIRIECAQWMGDRKASPQLTEKLSALPLFEKEDELSDENKMRFVRFLLMASTVTTRSLIGNATLALLQNPKQLELVGEDKELIPLAVEEALRYETPIPLAERRMTLAADVDGITIPAGSFVFLLLASANRDPNTFDEPDRFFVNRDASKHLSFADGPHYCLGATLARLETQIALETLFFRLNGLKLSNPSKPVQYMKSSKLRCPAEIQLTFDEQRRAG